MEYGVGAESEEEKEEGDVKVKVMKVHSGGDMSEMMDEILGHGQLKVM